MEMIGWRQCQDPGMLAEEYCIQGVELTYGRGFVCYRIAELEGEATQTL